MAGVLEEIELERLPRLCQPVAQFLGIGRRRILVFLAADDVDRAMRLGRKVDHRGRALWRGKRVGRRTGDEAAPTVDRRVDLVAAACEQQCPAAADAEADASDLAVASRLRAQERGRRLEVPHQLRILQPEHLGQHLVHVGGIF